MVIFRNHTLLLFITTHPVWSINYRLYLGPGEYRKDYDTTVANIAAGDSVQFSDEKTFHVYAVLGQGGTTKILAVNPTTALRIPINTRPEPRRSLNSYWSGSVMLNNSGVAMVQAYSYLANEYVTVERVNPILTFHEYLADVQKWDQRFPTIQAEFVTFAASTSRLSAIGDFSFEQIAFTEKGWILLDWSADSTRLAHPRKIESVFFGEKFKQWPDFENIPHALFSKIAEAILWQRISDKQRRFDSCVYQNALKELKN